MTSTATSYYSPSSLGHKHQTLSWALIHLCHNSEHTSNTNVSAQMNIWTFKIVSNIKHMVTGESAILCLEYLEWAMLKQSHIHWVSCRPTVTLPLPASQRQNIRVVLNYMVWSQEFAPVVANGNMSRCSRCKGKMKSNDRIVADVSRASVQ